jgi:repressor LexA
VAEHGLSPTLHEIGEALGINRVTVFEHVRALKDKGWIRSEPNLSRAIELVETESADAPSSDRGIPILGRIAAGRPIEAVEDRELFHLDDFFPTDRECYMLQVRGESMIEDQIRDGDFVLVESRPVANAGETVVALIDDGETTLKRYYPAGNLARLEPRNSTMQPILVDRSRLRIQGVVIGVLRRY